ncbi:hypothetical protein D7B24_009484 [Verticillium nonalfalfae]|uniref:Rhodopsin domain-containing protein n=2 Tax=Verticillium TaxID=1036719 RepID=C9SES4_VERA1|nr:conserved hypothetical protein [Verticillium alfalfae VaMs.102]XP_028492884.1 uncharacterized protein D7B24_009484 [Verticillium nonalfalfae]EEY16667.1 conserved hypothetical protein [Verticillium alfalfae VaMs.102]RNJ54726.1 hypothetical protein D7B24_009484 [Verticillium nonalfalfae]
MAKDHGQVVSWYICTAVAFVFVVARLWVRISKFRSLGIDDGFIILALCCLIGDLVIQQHMFNLGMSDMANVDHEQMKKIMQMIVPGSVLYVTTLWAIKIALVIFYKRIAAVGSTLQKIYNGALCVLVASWATIFFHILFQCFPHDKRWSQDPDYQCDPRNAEINYWLTIILNIGTDVILISLPISMVMKLQMKLKQKLGVAAIFALGFLVVIASIIRAYYSKRNETMLTCTVSMIEASVAIIATCLPPLRTLFLGHFSSAGTNSGYRHYELSSAGHARSRRTQQSRITTNIVGGTHKSNDSEDELVKDPARTAPPSGAVLAEEKGGGIVVSTTFQMDHGTDVESNRSTPLFHAQ